MRRGVIVDTGPLVAYLSERDNYHVWTRRQLEHVGFPLLTCEAVLTETCFLIGRNGGDAGDPIEMLNQGWLSIPFDLSLESEAIGRLMRKYANVPISLADSYLLRMTELLPESRLLTLDSDFSIYRKHGREPVPVVMPEE
uniref:Predicted nucleic acid-binding protein, contains PIN domain n=1 Tax=Candidatus Kentrum sp. MB TaxID=2138164 RepID=A0A450XHY3_9GAMM|nr:MAG: Predicted nucleic acid-binding protein, contains PIN domain [Candidatus Kentron sp. MB]VFK74118.1 MAG: Predicted nucleic acid-binding protein, contains PIN domain [Candidatus Kentron sp. MB]